MTKEIIDGTNIELRTGQWNGRLALFDCPTCGKELAVTIDSIHAAPLVFCLQCKSVIRLRS